MFDTPTSVIMQPTTLCNLDCRYCYLPLRRKHLPMSTDVAAAVARSIRPWTAERTVEVCWHGGEPLATGRAHLGALFACFDGLDVAHGVQTNAVLIDPAWCRFFSEHGVHVGVSIDGDFADSSSRVDLAGKPVHKRIIRGIELLQEHGHDVSVISVVSDPTPDRARRLYDFAVGLGIGALGVNIEEQEGVNTRSNLQVSGSVAAFWAALVDAWRANPVIRLREIDRALAYVDTVLRDDGKELIPISRIDPLPTIGYDGSVTLISPELAGFTSDRLGDFACGNVLDSGLDDLIDRGFAAPWVQELRRGLAACRSSCAYVEFCGGGQAANRHFEQGRFDGTETNYCRNSKKALLEGVLTSVRNRGAA